MRGQVAGLGGVPMPSLIYCHHSPYLPEQFDCILSIAPMLMAIGDLVLDEHV